MANAEQHEYWNGEGGEHWVSHVDEYSAITGVFESPLLDAARIGASDCVLDVGCGFGATTIAAARRAADGSALGADISLPMVEMARRRAADAGVANAAFEAADAQTHAFAPESFDVVISRFGVMFFDDPVAAFANLRDAAAPQARLAFFAWQGLFDNDWLLVAAGAAIEHVGMPELGDPEAAGPFSLESGDRVRRILGDSGWGDVELQDVRQTLSLPGDTPAAAAEFSRDTGLARVLFTDKDPDAVALAMQAMRDAYAERWTPDGLRLGSKSWLVTATRS